MIHAARACSQVVVPSGLAKSDPCFYNEARPHSSLGGRTPGEAYREGAEVW